MTPAATVLMLALAASPAEDLALLPLEPLGVELSEAREVEGKVRRALREVPGVELLDEARTRAAGADVSIRSCADPACLGRTCERLGVGAVVTGVVGGLGSFRSLVLRRTDRAGRVVTTVNDTLSGDPAQVKELACALLGRGPRCEVVAEIVPVPPPALVILPPPALPASPQHSRRSAWRTPAGLSALGLAAGAVATGAGLGASSRSIASSIERGTTGCAGPFDAYSSCVADRFSTGRSRAATANVLFGVGAALGVTGATILFWPDGAVSAGAPGAPVGATVHARF